MPTRRAADCGKVASEAPPTGIVLSTVLVSPSTPLLAPDFPCFPCALTPRITQLVKGVNDNTILMPNNHSVSIDDCSNGTYSINIACQILATVKLLVNMDKDLPGSSGELPALQLTFSRLAETAEVSVAGEAGEVQHSAVMKAATPPADVLVDEHGSAVVESPSPATAAAPVSSPEVAALPDVPWKPTATLLAEATAIEKEADEMEKLAGTLTDSFELILGSAISNKLATVGTLQDLMRDWDKKGDGEICKIEFRQCVTGTDKKSLGIQSADAEIDAFFATLDADGKCCFRIWHRARATFPGPCPNPCGSHRR